MRNLSIAAKLYLLLVPLVVMGIAVGLVARSGLDTNASDVIRAKQVKELAVSALALLLTQDDATKAMLLDPAKLADSAGKKIEAYDRHQATLAKMRALSPSPQISGLIEQLDTIDQHKLRPLDTLVLEGLAEGNAQEMQHLYFSQYEPLRAEYEALVKQLGAVAEQDAEAAVKAMAASNNHTFFYTILSLVLGIMLVGFILLCVTRGFEARIRASLDFLDCIACGDLTHHVVVDSQDELGQMAEGLNRAVEAMRGMLRGISDTAEQTAAAALQVSAAAEGLSLGVQEQATSLEETAASLEEMTSSVRYNADNTSEANQLAITSRSAAEQGGQVVTHAISAMDEISSSSQKIVDITSVIDEIAFQTNLLALNAAVEAARAGEQGRGFAVVAAEVRRLAQRSATAAKEIDVLIRNSAHQVAGGAKLVSQSGQTLEDIVSAVTRVTDLVGDITSASQEQAQGIEQVNKAVSQMDQITQTNAAQTEELNSTAQALTSQAEQLQTLVTRFKLDNAVTTQGRETDEPSTPILAAAVESGRAEKVQPVGIRTSVTRGFAYDRTQDFEEF